MFMDDDTRLRHMLESGREAMRFAEGRRREELDRDRQLVLALVKCVEIVGEAAARGTTEGRARFPSLPWNDIVGMRNRLIHGYYEVDLEQVWLTVRDDLPVLVRELEKGLASGG
jgi:uncharacterized protein with HEPN domain